MRLLLKNHFENAIESLRANRARTGLTLIGVAIGIASITTVLSLLTGATKIIGDQAMHVSSSVALVRSGVKPASNKADTNNHTNYTNSLTEKDAAEIATIKNTKTAPMSIIHTKVQASQNKSAVKDSTVLGTNQHIKDIAELKIREGQFIEETGGAVISEQLSIDLFGTENSLGNVIKIRGQSIAISGIIKPNDKNNGYLGVDFNNVIILPISVSKRLTQNVAQIQQIVINSPDRKSLDSAVAQASKILEANKHDNNDHYTLTGEEIINPSDQLISTIMLVTAIISGISLLVGGIGIMNIMLVSVAERQREIGIRKAVGATNHHIINQFLIESAIIGMLGGIIGYGLGLGAAFIISLYLPFTPIIHWQIAVATVGASLVIGTFFGVYPAIRAAQRDPIDSLRLS